MTLGWALMYVDEPLKTDFEVVLTAVQQNGRALTYASKELQRNRTVRLLVQLKSWIEWLRRCRWSWPPLLKMDEPFNTPVRNYKKTKKCWRCGEVARGISKVSLIAMIEESRAGTNSRTSQYTEFSC